MNFSLFRFGGAKTFSAQCTLIFPSVGSALPLSLPDCQVSLLAHKKRDKTMQRRMLQLKFMRQKLEQMTVTRSEGAVSSGHGGVNSYFNDCLGVSFAANTRIPPIDFIGCQTNPHSRHLSLCLSLASLGTLELKATWLQSISLKRRHNELACKLSFGWSASPPSSSELSLRLLITCPAGILLIFIFSCSWLLLFPSALDKFFILLSYNSKSYSNFSLLFCIVHT